jgi:hypothetical protein
MPLSPRVLRRSSIGGLFVLAVLLPPSLAQQQKRLVRIAFSRTSTVKPAELRKALTDACPNLELTRDPLRSDYALEAMAETINVVYPADVTRYRFTLFDRSGNIFFSTAPHTFAKAVHNICIALDGQIEGRDADFNDDEPRSPSSTPDDQHN